MDLPRPGTGVPKVSTNLPKRSTGRRAGACFAAASLPPRPVLTNRQLFLRHQAQTSPTPLLLEIERAEGCWMYGPDGARYLDLISGIAVSNVGHRHPRVLAAIQAQLDKYLHLMVYGELVQAPQVQLAAALAATVPDHLGCAYLVSSGSEAVEAALKLAKRLTGRAELISAIDSYHGATHGALSVTGNEGFRRAFRPLLPACGRFATTPLMTSVSSPAPPPPCCSKSCRARPACASQLPATWPPSAPAALKPARC